MMFREILRKRIQINKHVVNSTHSNKETDQSREIGQALHPSKQLLHKLPKDDMRRDSHCCECCCCKMTVLLFGLGSCLIPTRID